MESEDDPLIGCEIDRYRVLERIGVGATGCVYRVQHTLLEVEMAMKVLHGDLTQDQRFAERFRREAKAVSKMRHENLLSVTDFGRTEKGLTFLVMEYVRGLTLEEEIMRSAPFPIDRASRIVEQIAAGLGEAHRLGFIHRDVKPMNIMLTAQDRQEQVKILDFGIVGLRTEVMDARLTAAGFLIGTPAYMAPEQATDPSGVTPAADFYSLGVILFEMLTGRLPFTATQPVDMILKHSIEPLPDLPPAGGLEHLARWMLEKSPSNRPQSAGPILDAIAAWRRDLQAEEVTQPGLELEGVDLPLLDPVTYHGSIPREVYYERLCQRLEDVKNTLDGARISVEACRTFDARLADIIATTRPGLDANRYLDLADRISQLERQLELGMLQ